ncbi:uncharacterized protein C19orf44 homolog isoform X1 [Cuculus canorus]|uniref:uncharacterized protein C19orf44 homolog isoform X1 n=1 Tax=Cuculus canorus TaxID=55661 RepID=UPI0023AB4521|nr:uncharacterized protein C19orf44 homolog isoform X1 [Cuculus canorus]
MAAIAWAQRAAGGGRGSSDAPRRTITAGRSVLPRSCSNGSVADVELENTGQSLFHHSRFLKARNDNVRGGQWCQTWGSAMQTTSRHSTQSALGSAARSSSALRKVAQLESKIMNRKKQMELQNTDLGQKPLEEESFSSASSQEHSARGKKYLKKYTATSGNVTLGNASSREAESIQSPKKNVMVNQQLHLGSSEEEVRQLTKNSLEFSSGNENQRVAASDSKWGGKSKSPVPSRMPLAAPAKEISPTEVAKAASFRSKHSEKNGFGRVNSPTPSPASRNLSVRHNTNSQSLSSSIKDYTVQIALPRAGNAKQSQISLESDRSEIKSLDDLFSEAAGAQNSTSSDSHDFRLNILSLDDLAPDITSEVAESKQKGTGVPVTQESKSNPENDTSLVKKDQTALKKTGAVTGGSGASEGDIEQPATEAEISELSSGSSAEFPGHKKDSQDHEERTVNSEYSEDFENSLPTTDREPVSEMSEEHSKSCTRSGKHRSPPSSPLLTRVLHDRVHRVTVKEAAVQTVDSPFGPYQSAPNASVVLESSAGNSYVDPVPVASHIISTETLEALTAHGPSALVLNTILKQYVMLTQHFMENIRHLHTSLVESLEKENFHYHTLEEAKEYIKNHRFPPLTSEQAQEEIQKAQEEKQH